MIMMCHATTWPHKSEKVLVNGYPVRKGLTYLHHLVFYDNVTYNLSLLL